VYCFGLILGHATAVLEAQPCTQHSSSYQQTAYCHGGDSTRYGATEVELRPWMILFCCGNKPVHCFRMILLHSLASVVAGPYGVLLRSDPYSRHIKSRFHPTEIVLCFR
jgi:hypothetical protein